FFVTHLAISMLSAFAIALAVRPVPWWVAPPAFAAMAIVPLFYIYASSFSTQHKWFGFYQSPFPLPRYAAVVGMGERLRRLKQTNHDTYFDTAWDEPYRHNFLDELEIHGGSVFTLTPRRF